MNNIYFPFISFFAGVGLMAGLSGCSSEGQNDSVEAAPVELTQAESRGVAQQNNFGFKVLEKVGEKGNFALSPLSLNHALSMVANGAAGETQSELLDLLGAEDIDGLNRVNAKMLGYLPSADAKVKLETANAFFAVERAGLLPAYAGQLADLYDAEIYGAEKSAGEMGDHINDFICGKTKGGIRKGVETLGADVLWASVNTLCFKGGWANRFDRSKTVKAEFANYDGTVSKVDMMHLSKEASEKSQYVKNDVLEGVSMDFGNGRYAMTVAKPMDGASLEEGLGSLADGSMLRGAYGTLTSVAMPRFTVECFKDLAEEFKKLGLRVSFGAKADFSNICPEPSSIGHVYHAVRIEVNEEGSEAKASTVVEGMLGWTPQEHRELTFDSPFVFYITESASGAVVFAGKVTKF